MSLRILGLSRAATTVVSSVTCNRQPQHSRPIDSELDSEQGVVLHAVCRIFGHRAIQYLPLKLRRINFMGKCHHGGTCMEALTFSDPRRRHRSLHCMHNISHGLLICWGRAWRRNSPTSHALWNSGHPHHNQEALTISLWFFNATGLSFAIDNGLLTLDGVDPLRALDLAVELTGIRGLVLFQRSP